MLNEIWRIWGQSETMVNVSGQSIGYVTAITRLDTKYCNPFKDEFKIGSLLQNGLYNSHI